jgi:hypothetical protein
MKPPGEQPEQPYRRRASDQAQMYPSVPAPPHAPGLPLGIAAALLAQSGPTQLDLPQPHSAQSWERAVGRFYKDTDPEPAAKGPSHFEPAENLDNAAMRMSGLRNLILSLAMKNLNGTAENGEQAANATSFETTVQDRSSCELTYSEQSYTPFVQNSGRREVTATPSRPVTAPPEFLPPKTVFCSADNEQDRKNAGNAGNGHRDRRDAYDDVEILPSWRGQYRKKK